MYPDDVMEYMIDDYYESAECQYCEYFSNGYCDKKDHDTDKDDYCDDYKEAK